MGFHDMYRMSSHAVICNQQRQILLLKANYAEYAWGLPGGGLDVGETIHEALIRECQEELGCDIDIQYLSGVYYQSCDPIPNSQYHYLFFSNFNILPSFFESLISLKIEKMFKHAFFTGTIPF